MRGEKRVLDFVRAYKLIGSYINTFKKNIIQLLRVEEKGHK